MAAGHMLREGSLLLVDTSFVKALLLTRSCLSCVLFLLLRSTGNSSLGVCFTRAGTELRCRVDPRTGAVQITSCLPGQAEAGSGEESHAASRIGLQHANVTQARRQPAAKHMLCILLRQHHMGTAAASRVIAALGFQTAAVGGNHCQGSISLEALMM